MSNVKQVIVIRKDLQMRRGKEIAQGAHAAIGALRSVHLLELADANKLEMAWYANGTKKICVTVDSEAALLALYKQAQEAQLACYLVTDAGYTEFDGPTRTCLAIGPGESEKIDPLTGGLKLY